MSWSGDPLDELAAADLEQLGHAARDDGEVLAALRLVAGERAAVEDPVRVAPSSAASGVRSSGRSSQRWTLTIGESSSPGRSSSRRRALSRGGTATTIASASSSSSASTRATSMAHGRAVGRERAPGRVAVHRAERLRPAGSRSAFARGPSSAVRTVKSAGLGARLVGAQVERRPDEDVPEAVDRRVGRAEPAEERAERLVVGRPAPCAGARARAATRSRSRSGRWRVREERRRTRADLCRPSRPRRSPAARAVCARPSRSRRSGRGSAGTP